MNSSTCKGNRFEKNWMDQWGKRGNSSLWSQYSSYRSFCVSHTPSVIHKTSLHFYSYPRCSYFFFCRSYDVPVAPDSSLSAESSSPLSTHTNCPLPELLLANDIHTQFTKLIMERQVSIEEGEAKARDLIQLLWCPSSMVWFKRNLIQVDVQWCPSTPSYQAKSSMVFFLQPMSAMVFFLQAIKPCLPLSSSQCPMMSKSFLPWFSFALSRDVCHGFLPPSK